MKPFLPWVAATALMSLATLPAAEQPPRAAAALIRQNCVECHDAETKKGKLDLTALSFDLADPKGMERWVQIFDRVENGEMPPKSDDMKPADRKALLAALEPSLHAASKAETDLHGRGPMRRLNRLEFEQNLRDLLALPHLEALCRLNRYRRSARHAVHSSLALAEPAPQHPQHPQQHPQHQQRPHVPCSTFARDMMIAARSHQWHNTFSV